MTTKSALTDFSYRDSAIRFMARSYGERVAEEIVELSDDADFPDFDYESVVQQVADQNMTGMAMHMDDLIEWLSINVGHVATDQSITLSEAGTELIATLRATHD